MEKELTQNKHQGASGTCRYILSDSFLHNTNKVIISQFFPFISKSQVLVIQTTFSSQKEGFDQSIFKNQMKETL